MKVVTTLSEFPNFEAEVFAKVKVKVLQVIEEENENLAKIQISGLTENPFEHTVNVEDIGGNIESPDLGDLIRLLLELLKKTLCPQCL